AQASAGQAVYSARCAACHGARFEPTQGVPPVRGPAFLANWRGRTVGELYRLVHTTMPPGAARSLSDEQHLAAVAYILQANGFPEGQPLPADDAALRGIGFGSGNPWSMRSIDRRAQHDPGWTRGAAGRWGANLPLVRKNLAGQSLE